MKLFLTLALTLGLVSCASISPQQKQKIFKRADTVAFKKNKRLRSSRKNRVPIRKGQWVTYLTEFKGKPGDVQLTTMKVVDVSGKDVTLEMESFSAAGDGVRQRSGYVVEGYPKRAKVSYSKHELDRMLNNIRFKRMVTQNGDAKPMTVPSAILNLTNSFTRNLLVNAHRVGKMSAVKCNVEKISSRRCYEYKFQTNVMGLSSTGKITAHSDIPIYGWLKHESEDFTMKVVAFGHKGAKARLF